MAEPRVLEEIGRLLEAELLPAQDHKSDSWPLATSTFGVAEILAATAPWLDGRVTMGPRVAEFETRWSERLGVPASLMVNSGSSANLLALAAAANPDDDRPLIPGDEVIVPAVTWPTSVYPIAQVGCVPILVDIDPVSLNLDPKRVREALTPRTRALMLVHLLGHPCEMNALMDLAHENDLLVIEDCCEATGARSGGQPVGTFGNLSTFSFYFSHHMTTIEGGMISTSDPSRWIDSLRSLRTHGWIRDRTDCEELARAHGYEDDRFVFVAAGYNCRPTEINAGIGLVQLERIADFIERRRRIRAHLCEVLAPYESMVRTQSESPSDYHSAFALAMVLTPQAPFPLRELREHLEARGIETRPIVGGNLARQPAIRQLNVRVAPNLEHAEWIDRNGLMIGVNPNVTDAQLEHCSRVIRSFFDGAVR